MNSDRINKLLNDGRHQAIIKEIAGCRYLFGFERINPRSRKRKVKFMLRAPLNLTQLESSHKAKKEREAQAAASDASNLNPPTT